MEPGDSMKSIMKTALASFVVAVLFGGELLTSSVAAHEPIVGFTEPIRTVELAASQTGTLTELNVRPGQRVEAGEIIGSLDVDVLRASRDVAVAKQESEARLTAARIRLNRAEEHYNKLRQLRDEGHGGKRELQIAESDYELARNDVESVNEEILLAGLEVTRIDAEIRRRQIVSSIDGVISDVHREVGEYVSANSPHVLTIVELRQLRIRFYVPAMLAEPFDARDRIDIVLMHNHQTLTGTIDFVAPVIDADSNTVRIDVLVDNSKGKLRSGRRCQLHVDSHRPGVRDRQLEERIGKSRRTIR